MPHHPPKHHYLEPLPPLPPSTHLPRIRPDPTPVPPFRHPRTTIGFPCTRSPPIRWPPILPPSSSRGLPLALHHLRQAGSTVGYLTEPPTSDPPQPLLTAILLDDAPDQPCRPCGGLPTLCHPNPLTVVPLLYRCRLHLRETSIPSPLCVPTNPSTVPTFVRTRAEPSNHPRRHCLLPVTELCQIDAEPSFCAVSHSCEPPPELCRPSFLTVPVPRSVPPSALSMLSSDELCFS